MPTSPLAPRLGLAYSLSDVRELTGLISPALAEDLPISTSSAMVKEALHVGLVDGVVGAEEVVDAIPTFVRSL